MKRYRVKRVRARGGYIISKNCREGGYDIRRIGTTIPRHESNFNAAFKTMCTLYEIVSKEA